MIKRMNIVVGHYGSGKTEFAINYAIMLKKTYQKVYIVDLDIVNPYFRSNDVKEELKQLGIEVIASAFAGTNVDIPALPSEIQKVFAQQDAAVVFDVGGDDDGAIALGRYKPFFEKEVYEMFFVINTFRPMTKNKKDITELLNNIEIVSRLKITGLVNNSNIAHLTTVEDVLCGQQIVKEVSDELHLPISYISGMQSVLGKHPEMDQSKLFYINRYLEISTM